MPSHTRPFGKTTINENNPKERIMNVITLAGHLGKDAEIRWMPDGEAVASFSIADSKGPGKPTLWWACQMFGRRAQALAPYLLKGQQVTVSGCAAEREWTDRDGHKRKSLDVRVSDLALQGGRKEAQAPQEATPASRPQGLPRLAAPAANVLDDIDGEIPF